MSQKHIYRHNYYSERKYLYLLEYTPLVFSVFSAGTDRNKSTQGNLYAISTYCQNLLLTQQVLNIKRTILQACSMNTQFSSILDIR